jgi:GNAT superfamily N-acetyltransferase
VTADASVRSARPDEAEAIGGVQSDSWRAAYAGVLPAEVLDALTADALAKQWRPAVENPPTPRHRVLVALAGDTVVGFAALGPATDPDRDPALHAELYALVVGPSAQRQGHGSRLLAAAADHLRADGFTTVVAWVPAVDEAMIGFLVRAGWAPDGSQQDLDPLGNGRGNGQEDSQGDSTGTFRQVRLHTDLTGG